MTTAIHTHHFDQLDDQTLNHLSAVLRQFQSEKAMNLDEFDGFCAALHCAPEMIPPSEFLPELWGGEDRLDYEAFEDKQQAEDSLHAIMQHWNNVGRRLEEDTVFLPVFMDDESPGCDWSRGFLRGMRFFPSEWSDFMNDEELGGPAVLPLLFAYENDPDPELRPFDEPLTPEKREELLPKLAASVTAIYDHFADQRQFNARVARDTGTIRRDYPKVGRNAPCPCGSGKKYKKCCADMLEH
jgi:uncharacterized protein